MEGECGVCMGLCDGMMWGMHRGCNVGGGWVWGLCRECSAWGVVGCVCGCVGGVVWWCMYIGGVVWGRGGVRQCAVGDMVWCMWYMICVGVCMGVWYVCVCLTWRWGGVAWAPIYRN